MRLFAALGPGDIVAAQRRQLLPGGSPAQTSITFSGQLYEYCRQRKIQALFISCHDTVDRLHTPQIELLNLPNRWGRRASWRFHLGRLWYGAQLAWRAWRFKADLAVIDSGTTHYFVLALFRLFGIAVAVNFHNVRWPQGYPPRKPLGRLIRRLDSWFFRSIASAALGCSAECAIQARADRASHLRYFGWCGQYRRSVFANAEPPVERNPFRALFVGRIERSKGVFDLIEVSRLLIEECPFKVIIEVCGDGSALGELRDAVRWCGFEDRILLRGRLDGTELVQAYARTHVVIVPTRSDFSEGLPLVCAEAVLAGRPVVTNRLSNALPSLGAAIAEAQPDQPASYARAICRLAQDLAYYRRLYAACTEVARPFLDRDCSYPAAVDRLVGSLSPEWTSLRSAESLFKALA
jgi:glycosyltransferase involved in cell wall biosynthesis